MTASVEARTAGANTPAFVPAPQCWVCGHDRLVRVQACRFEFGLYAQQDPELAAYTGAQGWIRRCGRCGFGQPEALPALPGYFDRMYDQRWSNEWVEQEFRSEAKTLIFRDVLRALEHRLPAPRRRLLDVGAHVGRFLQMAQESGWKVEGIELNPTTAAYAARRTHATIHQANAEVVALGGRRFDAVTLIDVLEHIPDPVRVLTTAGRLLEQDGWIAVKVPSGPNQLRKERLRAALQPGYRATVADNLVHVNHFSPRSLERALERAGFSDIAIVPAAPELVGGPPRPIWWRLGDAVRLGFFRLARAVPGGAHLPISFNLQAYARCPNR